MVLDGIFPFFGDIGYLENRVDPWNSHLDHMLESLLFLVQEVLETVGQNLVDIKMGVSLMTYLFFVYLDIKMYFSS
jgi:hypothetical protein